MRESILTTGIMIITILLLLNSPSKGDGVIIWKSSERGSTKLTQDQKKGMAAKVGWMLADLYEEHQSYLAKGTEKEFESSIPSLKITKGLVVIDAIASGDVNKLRSDLEELGMENIAVFGRIVSGQIPIDAIDDMAELESLKFARASIATTNVGECTSQGDAAMRSDIARDMFGVDGSGVTVGTLSDTYDCLGGAAADVASGDLPSGIVVLEEGVCFPGTDEGRALMQIIRDVAPGASQVYHTAEFGQANFAQGIMDLADFGADVIVDDIIYLAEPMFQDGGIAQAVDTVVNMGVPYFSSAGNDGRKSYQSNFNASGEFFTLDSITCEAHDFDPGPGVDTLQSITIPEGSLFSISFQWDSPFFSVSGPPGSPNDIDILLVDSTGTVLFAGGIDFNIGADAVEVFEFLNLSVFGITNFNLVIGNCGGPDPGLIKYIFINPLAGMTINEFDTESSTVYGHINATGAEAVGAARFDNTPAFGINPPILEPFSSGGGTPILFDTSGNPFPSPVIRQKPEIVGPDGVGTTFFGFPTGDMSCPFSFHGTSASAPHAAGVAALILDFNPSLSPSEIYSAMEITAIEMAPIPRTIAASPRTIAGNQRTMAARDDIVTSGLNFNFDSGFGFIQADSAIQQVSGPPPPPPTGIKGDANEDGTVTSADITCVILGIFGMSCPMPDCNEDGSATSADITCVILAIFGTPPPQPPPPPPPLGCPLGPIGDCGDGFFCAPANPVCVDRNLCCLEEAPCLCPDSDICVADLSTCPGVPPPPPPSVCQSPPLNNDFSDRGVFFVDSANAVLIGITSDGDLVTILLADIPDSGVQLGLEGDVLSSTACDITLGQFIVDGMFSPILGATGQCRLEDNFTVFVIEDLFVDGIPLGVDLSGECVEIVSLEARTESPNTLNRAMLDKLQKMAGKQITKEEKGLISDFHEDIIQKIEE